MTAPEGPEAGRTAASAAPYAPAADPGRWAASLALLGLALLALGPWVDRPAQGYYEAGFQRALVAFGIARSLNGVISVIQGTEVAVEPAGVGVNFAPGQIVDPVNDLIERFSWVMLASTTSLGIQHVFMEMSAWGGTRALATGAAVAALVLLWMSGRQRRAHHWALRLALLAVFLRFAMPLVVLLNHGVYVVFLEADYEASRAAVEATSERLSAISEEVPAPERSGWFDRARGWLDDQAEALDWRARLDAYQAQLAEATEHLLRLTAVFVLQTILLPLLFLWALARAARGIARVA